MSLRVWAFATATSGAVHAAVALASPHGHAPRRLDDAPPTLVTFDEIPVAPPEAPAPAPPEKEAPTRAPSAPVPHSAPKAANPTPSTPAVAAAGRTLTLPEAPTTSDVADFTLAQGNADAYAGGTTAATGVETTPGREPSAAAPAVPTSTQAPPPKGAPAVDLSRAASAGNAEWSCSHLFPSDADAPDTAAVRVSVDVRPDGTPVQVNIVSDPGHGFGAAARRCAMSQRFQPALGLDGRAIAGRTPPFIVRFRR